MKTFLSFLSGIVLLATATAQTAPEWEINNIENRLGKYTAVDGNGDVLIVGNGTYFAFGSLNIYVKKYDPAGNLIWETTIAAVQDPTSGVTEMVHANWLGIDSEDNVLITGYKFTTTSGSCFPSGICKVPIGLKIYKLDAAGNLIYNQTHEDLGGADLTSFAQPNWGEIDESDNLYVSTRGLYTDSQGDTDFGPVLLKFDSSGALVWSDVQDIFSNTVSDDGMDYNSGRIAMIAGKTSGSGAVLLWDESGNLLWQNPSPEGAFDYTDVYLDESGNVYALSWWWEMPFPTQKVNVTKYDVSGVEVFSQTYLFDEPTTPGRIAALPSGDLVFAAANWTSFGEGTLYTKIISSGDGSEVEAFTSELPHVTSRVWDLKVSAAGNIYVAGRSYTNAGAPATGWVRGFNAAGEPWSVDYQVRDVMAIAVSSEEDIYLVTENSWNLVKYNSGFTSSVPCEAPYPAATGLTAVENPDGTVGLSWNPIPGSIGCQLNIAELSSMNSVSLIISAADAASFTIPSNPLSSGESYAFRVRCGCSQNPLVIGPWSPYEVFNYGGSGIGENNFDTAFEDLHTNGEIHPWKLLSAEERDVFLYPNPASNEFYITLTGSFSDLIEIEIYSLEGRKVKTMMKPSSGSPVKIDRGNIPGGFYLVRIRDGAEVISRKILLK